MCSSENFDFDVDFSVATQDSCKVEVAMDWKFGRETMVQAIQNRDKAFVGEFVVGVKSTKIFCRPGCPARTPKPENMEFFQSPLGALASGYRPCLRCQPQKQFLSHDTLVTELTKLVDKDPQVRFTDIDLSAKGYDPDQVRRAFRRAFGTTFHGYSRARRLGLALGTIGQGSQVSEAAADFGYESDSGFRDAFLKAFSIQPSRSREVAPLLCRWFESRLGPVLAVADDTSLFLLEFGDRKMLKTQLGSLQKVLGRPMIPGRNSVLDHVEGEFHSYLTGRLLAFSVPFNLKGTPFQEKVWKELLKIKYGETRSYAQIAP
ncbi:MAG: bifunctional transcriptional activator/DNA repair protein Ada, partial [Chthonomonadaceae bacterium]|nr:bifunctional transcriptional activator/DNA repair protein Ada [Chthonomonadaceae bacterium]